MANDVIKIVTGDKTVHLKVSQRSLLVNGFISGLAWGVGSVVGATLIVGLVLFLLGQLDTAPIIGRYISNILDYIQTSR